MRGNFSNVAQSGNGENEATLNEVGQLIRSHIRQSNDNSLATANVCRIKFSTIWFVVHRGQSDSVK